ncbi:MAG: ACT domain-containing protein [Lysobacterales bacterium]|jgi:glycine cleavage system regulatory protein
MKTSIVLTVIADDHPGIINMVSEVLYKHGGAWTESSMASLAGQFAGILLASVNSESAQACVEELQGLESKGLHVIAQLGGTPHAASATREYMLDLVGNDRRGIVHDITAILARHNVNVQQLETVVEGVPMAGGEVFKATARLLVSQDTDIDALEGELEAIANELMVKITLEQ